MQVSILAPGSTAVNRQDSLMVRMSGEAGVVGKGWSWKGCGIRPNPVK